MSEAEASLKDFMPVGRVTFSSGRIVRCLCKPAPARI